MISPDNGLWLQCWRDRQTDFHQLAVNPLLSRFWPRLDLPLGSRIFVPLCGKSLDMLWLAAQGHEVIGVELSPIAVRQFFRDNQLKPKQTQQGQLTLWRHDNLSIFCGDYFALKPTDLGQIDAVYDRAALTALPEHIRLAYVTHLRKIVPATADVFLLTTEDAEPDETDAQTLDVSEEIKNLYSQTYHIELTHVESVFEGSPPAPERTEYKVYRLNAKPPLIVL
jgi:thiopurine S-methyltransferase